MAAGGTRQRENPGPATVASRERMDMNEVFSGPGRGRASKKPGVLAEPGLDRCAGP
jgi:hypothetical protein